MVKDMNKMLKNNKYLTDNGFVKGNAGFKKELSDFIDKKIGSGGFTAKTPGFSTKIEAREAAIASFYAEKNPGPAGWGIIGRRLRRITVEVDDNLETPVYYYKCISGNPTSSIEEEKPQEPNFWGDDPDSLVQDANLKTSFLEGLEEIKTKLAKYKGIINKINLALTKITLGKNPAFPKVLYPGAKGYSSFKIEEVNTSKTVNKLNNHITEIDGYYAWFNDDSRTGAEAIFDEKISNLKKELESLQSTLLEREEHNYLSSELFKELKTQRKFWIEERILKFSGSLVSYKSMREALASATSDLKAKETALSKISDNKDEWIKAPDIFASYYNPIIEETIDSSEEVLIKEIKRISFIRNSYEHTTEYLVLRKEFSESTLPDLYSNEEKAWVPGVDGCVALNKKHKRGVYDDNEDISAENAFYAYRIQAIDNDDIQDNKRVNSKSLQSSILGRKVEISIEEDSYKIMAPEELSGFVYIGSKVNYIKSAKEVETTEGTFFLLNMKNEVVGSPTSLKLLTCIAPNHFISE